MVREKGRSLLHGVDGGMEQTIGADWGDFARTANDAFLLAFPSLFSIINPIGGALIFYGVTKDFATADREKVAALVGLYSLLIMFGALWAGAYVLRFFGVSIDALRIAGGTVIALSGFQLLTSGDYHPDQKGHEHAGEQSGDGDPMQLAFFPLTLPFTTGPGTIAVAITIGAERPRSRRERRRSGRHWSMAARRERGRGRQRCDHLDRLSLRRPTDGADGGNGAHSDRAADRLPAHVHRGADSGHRDRRPRGQMAGCLMARLQMAIHRQGARAPMQSARSPAI
jgi:MarC family membrane protein